MKKTLALLCATILLLSVPCAAVAATSTNYLDEQSIAKEVMSSFGTYTVKDYVELYDAGGDVEAVCFNFLPKGYAIVNVNDFSIPEFSPEAVTPFPNELDSNSHYIYVGPLNYYFRNALHVIKSFDHGIIQI